MGVGFSRNLGIKKARGKYVVFLDSDDALLENSLNNLEKFITINNSPDVIPVRYQKITYPQNNYKFIKDNKKNHDVKKLIKYVLSEKIPFQIAGSLCLEENFLIIIKYIFPIRGLVKVKYLWLKLFVICRVLRVFKKNFTIRKID